MNENGKFDIFVKNRKQMNFVIPCFLSERAFISFFTIFPNIPTENERFSQKISKNFYTFAAQFQK